MICRTCLLLVAASLVASNLQAAESSFVGKWKINLDKSKITGFQEKIEDLGHDEMKFIFGDDTETYFFDGKEHPTRYGSTRIVTAEASDQWKAVTKRDGKVTNNDVWTLTDSGRILTIRGDGSRPDGTIYKQEFRFKRIAGTNGLAGTWESMKVDPDAYPDWVIEPFEGDGLGFNVPSFKELHNLKFDGKDYPNEGPRVAPGASTAGKRVDPLTLELTDKIKDKVIDVQRLELSADGKTLTVTVTYPGVEQKEVDVFERK